MRLGPTLFIRLLTAFAVVSAAATLTLLVKVRSIDQSLEESDWQRLQRAATCTRELVRSHVAARTLVFESIAQHPQTLKAIYEEPETRLKLRAREIQAITGAEKLYFLEPGGEVLLERLAKHAPGGLEKNQDSQFVCFPEGGLWAQIEVEIPVPFSFRGDDAPPRPHRLLVLDPISTDTLDHFSYLTGATIEFARPKERSKRRSERALPVLGSNEPRPLWVRLPEQPSSRVISRLERIVWVVGALALALGGLASRILSRSANIPVRQIKWLRKRIEAGDVDWRIRSKRRDELGDAARAVDALVSRLVESNEKLRSEKDRAEDGTKAKSQFLANMSHELRTPMNAIIGMTELTLETDLKTDQRDYLNTVVTSAEFLLTLLNDILDFSKIEAGSLQLSRTPFDLREVVDQVLKTVAVRAAEKSTELIAVLPPRLPCLLVGDADRIRQILVNLVGNAIKFTDGGEVVIRVGQNELNSHSLRLRVSVRDTGIGIPPEKQQAIFRAFQQVDGSTSRRFGGTGLGLSISSQLVRLMGGEIWVESQLGEGSTFHFSIPLQIQKTRFSLPEPNLGPVVGKRALVVDDNEASREMISGALSFWGMIPTSVGSGLEALEAMEEAVRQKTPFSVAIVDVTMPVMDGFSLADNIRISSAENGIPLVFLTSVGQKKLPEPWDRMPKITSVCKPINLFDLLEGIQNATSLRPRPAPQRYATQPHPQHTTDKRSLDILLVEDTLANQKLASLLLRKHKHEVTIANNGVEALEILDSSDFDLILMDVQMPEMDGLEATRNIRRREAAEGGHIPIIAMTAHAMQGDRERCLESGMDDYVAKPIRVGELLQTIRRHTPDSPDEDRRPSLDDSPPPILG